MGEEEVSAYAKAKQDPRWQEEMAAYLAVDLDNQTSADHALLRRMQHIQALYEIEHEYEEAE